MELTEPTVWNAERLELGEGLRWVDDRLVLVDLLAGRLLETDGDRPAPLKELRRLDVPLGAVAPVADRPGEWLATAGTGVAVLPAAGAPRPVADLVADAPEPTRMNDAVADPHGRFWAGSMTYAQTPGGGTLFRLTPGATPVPAVTGMSIPNGPAFDAAGTTMYLADTPRGEIDRFAVDPVTGDLHGRTPFVRLSPGEGSPDGMTLDAAGHLWVALWGGSSVRRYRPDGSLDREIQLPAAQPAGICLGGADLRRLFIGTASVGLTSAGPTDGALLAVDIPVPGLPVSPAQPV
ncbi:SMP-30/gluconolactonase/LRE family protein [Micromonospora sp. CA-246542]|uniref:SMP-30/gluconolactonase/LRE family protein n=1 Tax=Micromonospora sp. CA-246542 TaxID=3239959 RepID=UPI003D91F989